MSRLVIQVSRREVSSAATAIIELGPGQPVRYESGDRVVSDVLRLERPLPLSALVRQVLTRYGLELPPADQMDREPCAEGELHCVPQSCETERGPMRA